MHFMLAVAVSAVVNVSPAVGGDETTNCEKAGLIGAVVS